MSDEKKIVIKAEQEKDTAQENTNPALLMKTPAMPLKMEFAEKITKEPEVKIKKANSWLDRIAWYYPDTKKSASRIYHGNLMEKWTSKNRYTKQICLVKNWTYRARVMELRELSTLLWAKSKEKSRCGISLTLSCEKAHRIIIQRAFAV